MGLSWINIDSSIYFSQNSSYCRFSVLSKLLTLFFVIPITLFKPSHRSSQSRYYDLLCWEVHRFLKNRYSSVTFSVSTSNFSERTCLVLIKIDSIFVNFFLSTTMWSFEELSSFLLNKIWFFSSLWLPSKYSSANSKLFWLNLRIWSIIESSWSKISFLMIFSEWMDLFELVVEHRSKWIPFSMFFC